MDNTEKLLIALIDALEFDIEVIYRSDINNNIETYDFKLTRRKKQVKASNKRFTRPTVEEVQEYIIDKRFTVDAELFINHYDANGWVRGKTPIKDWKACVRTWAKRGNNETNNRQSKSSRVASKLDEIAARDIAANGFTNSLDN